jgi:hypothetical protein
MTNWKRLADSNPAPSLLDAIAHAEHEENMFSDEAIEAYIAEMRAVQEQPLNYPIRINNAEGFVAHLRTLPNDEAVALVKHALREGDVSHNRRELLRSDAFTQWLVDMAKSGALVGDDK